MGALAPHGVVNGLDRETYLRLYRDLLSTLVTRQLKLGQSAVLDCLVNDATLGRWRDLADDAVARVLTHLGAA